MREQDTGLFCDMDFASCTPCSEIKTVGNGMPGKYYGTKSTGTECLVVNNLTLQLAEAQVYDTFRHYEGDWRIGTSEEVINDWAQILLNEFDLVAGASEGDDAEFLKIRVEQRRDVFFFLCCSI